MEWCIEALSVTATDDTNPTDIPFEDKRVWVLKTRERKARANIEDEKLEEGRCSKSYHVAKWVKMTQVVFASPVSSNRVKRHDTYPGGTPVPQKLLKLPSVLLPP